MTNENDLDGLLQHARQTAHTPAPALIERVLSDAYALQSPGQPVLRQAAPSPSLLSRLVRGLGGALGLAGLTTAALAGVGIGFYDPPALAAWTQTLTPSSAIDTVELIPDLDVFMDES